MAEARTRTKVKKATKDLPFNETAEKVVLGSAMLRKDYLNEVINSLEVEDFFLGKHQSIYRAILALFERVVDVDVLTVTEELINLKELENVGGADYLASCTSEVVASSTLKHYIRIVEDNSVMRSMLNCLREIDREYKEEEIENLNDFVLRSEEFFNKTVARRRVSEFYTTSKIAPEIQANLEKLQDEDNDDGVTGLSTGYEKLNYLTQGFKPGELIIVAARPSVGKTALCLNFAQRVAKSNKAVAIFSLEMSKEQLFNRLLAISSMVSASNIQSGKIKTAKERANILEGMKELSRSKIYIDDTPGIKLNDIIAKSTKLLANEKDLGLIVVDYLGLVQLASKSKGAESRQEEVRRISLALKDLARNLNIPVVVVSQLNRDVEKRDNKRPMMSDLRDSGNIEQDADIVMLIYREDYYSYAKKDNEIGNKKGGQLSEHDKYELAKQRAEKERGSALPGDAEYCEVIVAKNRNGRTGKVPLFFYKEFLKFDPPSREWVEMMEKMGNDE